MKILQIITMTFFATSTFAQGQLPGDAPSVFVPNQETSGARSIVVKPTSAHAEATAFVSNTVQQGLIDSMLSPEAIMATVGLIGSGLPPEKVPAIAQIVSEELTSIRPALEASIVTGMMKNFTAEEIAAWNEFSSSPAGESALRKMTPFLHNAMTTFRPHYTRVQGNIWGRIVAELAD